MINGAAFFNLLGETLAVFFTFMVLLYAVGDNTLFRLMIHIFIGVAAGYASAIAVREVLLPQLLNFLVQGNWTFLFVAIFWITLLLFKISPKTTALGNPATALLVGVGSALAVGGAIQGTLIPQIASAGSYFNPVALDQALRNSQFGGVLGFVFYGLITLFGTVSTLIYFHFTAKFVPHQIPRRHRVIEWIGWVGKGFIAVTYGVIFAGVYSAALGALIERFSSIVQFINTLMSTVAGQ